MTTKPQPDEFSDSVERNRELLERLAGQTPEQGGPDPLVVEIARELYDRFVMGGWEPQDAYPQIERWLDHSTQAAPSPEKAGAEITINDAERLIRKLEHCTSISAKLILLRNFAERAATHSTQALRQSVAELERERDQYIDAFLVGETIQSDGSLRATVKELVTRAEQAERTVAELRQRVAWAENMIQHYLKAGLLPLMSASEARNFLANSQEPKNA